MEETCSSGDLDFQAKCARDLVDSHHVPTVYELARFEIADDEDGDWELVFVELRIDAHGQLVARHGFERLLAVVETARGLVANRMQSWPDLGEIPDGPRCA